MGLSLYEAKNRAAPPSRQSNFGCAHDVYEEHGRVLYGLGKARKQERTHPPLSSVLSTLLDPASVHPAFRPAANQQHQPHIPPSSAEPLVVTSWRHLIGFLPVLRYWKMSFDARTRGRGDPWHGRLLRVCNAPCPVVFAISHRRTVAASEADAK